MEIRNDFVKTFHCWLSYGGLFWLGANIDRTKIVGGDFEQRIYAADPELFWAILAIAFISASEVIWFLPSVRRAMLIRARPSNTIDLFLGIGALMGCLLIYVWLAVALKLV